jgi:hypothetical protein
MISLLVRTIRVSMKGFRVSEAWRRCVTSTSTRRFSRGADEKTPAGDYSLNKHILLLVEGIHCNAD